jgi:hypothetical protein
MVEHVEGLGTDSELDAFSDPEGLEEAHIHVEETRPGVLVTALRRVGGWQEVKGIQKRTCIETRRRRTCDAGNSFATGTLSGRAQADEFLSRSMTTKKAIP